MQQNNKIGRNDKCPCGSGKKYKNCCLNSEPVKPSLSQSRQKPKLSFSLERPPAVKVTPKFPPSWLEKEFGNIEKNNETELNKTDREHDERNYITKSSKIDALEETMWWASSDEDGKY